MAIRTAIWKVGNPPTALAESVLSKERDLEDMIVAAPDLLDDQIMLIGRQVYTEYGGFIDLLALDSSGSLILIELKRDRTPREVVAQALDYASYVQGLRADAVAKIYSQFKEDGNLTVDFQARFGIELDDETLSGNHQIIIVAASLDPSTERIVTYLSSRSVAINVLLFQVFAHGPDKFISRSWLIDPAATLANAEAVATGEATAAWNGETYLNYGHGTNRSWSEALKHGFVCAGGGDRYTRTLRTLEPGNRLWVNVPGYGYGGVARVTGEAQSSAEFQLPGPDGESRPALEVLTGANYHRDATPDQLEYFVPVVWLQAVPLEQIVREVGLFGIPSTVCRPTANRWLTTIDRLKKRFPKYDSI